MSCLIGIIGFGVVGRSVLQFLFSDFFLPSKIGCSKEFRVAVWDKRLLEASERALLRRFGVESECGSNNKSLEEFVLECDLVIPSAGVDVSVLPEHCRDRLIGEVDLFKMFNKNKTIAVTGSLGKTTVTQLIVELVKNNFGCRMQVGGNVGVGLTDLVVGRRKGDWNVLELSSFQLELCRQFSADVSVFTNLYPNHLNRHHTVREYLRAKLNLIRSMYMGQSVLLPVELLENNEYVQELQSAVPEHGSGLVFLCKKWPANSQLQSIFSLNAGFMCLDDNFILRFISADNVYAGTVGQLVFDCKILPCVGFHENWILALGALFFAGFPVMRISKKRLEAAYDATVRQIGEHRVELCGNVRGIDFYNDSKATLIQATEAAVEKLSTQYGSIHLILGGLDKGVNRSAQIIRLMSAKSIASVVCIGQPDMYPHGVTVVSLLDDALERVMAKMVQGQAVLFSPGGASFDFYSNYRERGRVFKEHVMRLADLHGHEKLV